MARYAAPVSQLEFGGVVSAGNVLRRPAASSVKCENFRLMPGGWLRLRSGRQLRVYSATGRYDRIHEFRPAAAGGGVFHLVQHYDGTIYRWKSLSLPAYALANLETISTANGFSNALPAAICNLRNRVVMYNGLGVRGTDSKPPFSSWDGTTVRYFGLDIFAPAGGLSVAFNLSGTGTSKLIYGRDLYVGLYNSATGHFSNGTLVGKTTNADPTTTIQGNTVLSGLGNVTTVSHGATETGELKLVFYATLDGGKTPYLVLLPDGSGPLTAAPGTATVTIDLNSVDQTGHIVDVTQEMPTDNHPPRPMTNICYANGRIYGCPQVGGTGGTYGGFSYVFTDKDLPSVVWTATADDAQERSWVGIPEESWPLANRKYVPNGEQPIRIEPGFERSTVLVLTKTGCFYLQETADRLHQWINISVVDGIWDHKTFVQTPYGAMWLTQRKQIVLLPKGGTDLQFLSNAYSDLFSALGGVTVADYIQDPLQYTDRYMVWIGDGLTAVVHDFVVGGQAYTERGPFAYTAAKTVLDVNGQQHHIAADSSLFTHEAAPENGQIPMKDDLTPTASQEVGDGDYIGQWLDFGDSQLRKELTQIDVIGDGEKSPQLGDIRPLSIQWYGNFSQGFDPLDLDKREQSETIGGGDQAYRGKVAAGMSFWYKFRLKLKAHSTEGSYYTLAPLGETPPVFYGTIYAMLLTISGVGGNRP